MMEFTNPKFSDIPTLKILWQEAFCDGAEFSESFFSTAFSPDHAFCIKEGNKILSALYILDCSFEGEPIAYVYAVATAKSHRGQGLASKLMEFSESLLKNRGYKAAVLVPGEKGLFDFYKKLGYNTIIAADRFEAAAKEADFAISKIEKEEFCKLRREFLPEKAVLQEDVSLEYLAAYCSFYKGCDFLLAAYENADTLYAAELLGNRTRAEGIVYLLGCKKGSFKTTGENEPYALMKPFCNITVPKYFGLAFE